MGTSFVIFFSKLIFEGFEIRYFTFIDQVLVCKFFKKYFIDSWQALRRKKYYFEFCGMRDGQKVRNYYLNFQYNTMIMRTSRNKCS